LGLRPDQARVRPGGRLRRGVPLAQGGERLVGPAGVALLVGQRPAALGELELHLDVVRVLLGQFLPPLPGLLVGPAGPVPAAGLASCSRRYASRPSRNAASASGRLPSSSWRMPQLLKMWACSVR